jgi:voltage-gated potassium channel
MVALAFVWLALLVAELVWGERRAFLVLGTLIWGVFLLDFGVKLVLVRRKTAYLRRNWLSAISLLVPALRIFRIVRVVRLLRLARVGRGLRLFRLLISLNRGMRALGASLHRRGFAYIVALTAVVVTAGSAGMYAFERQVAGGLDSYGEALWWTTMVMTTLGSDTWPQTFEGRVLCVFLALYAFGIFGYVTATLATFFVGRDAESSDGEVAGSAELAALRRELAALRGEIRAVSGLPPES